MNIIDIYTIFCYNIVNILEGLLIMSLRARARTSSAKMHSAYRKTRNFVGAATVAAGVTASLLAMFLPINLLQVGQLYKSVRDFATSSADSSVSAAPVQAPVQGCDVRNTTDTNIFAECPSFALNYATAKSGIVDQQYLNVTSGRSTTNNEAETYTASTQNLRVENGALLLEAHREISGQTVRYTSAKVDTKGKKDFTYGKLVIQAKVPTGVGTWPAIWMLPSAPKYAGLGNVDAKYRYLNDGEIDILEAIGSQPGTVYSVAHNVTYDNNGVDRKYFNTVQVPNNNVNFQTYELNWTPTNLTFKINGQPYFSYDKPANADYKTWPYDQPFYLVMNLALGGNWAGQDRANFPENGIDGNALPTSLQIKSVHYYPYILK